MGWGHKKEEEGKGAHKSPPSSEEAEGRGWARGCGLGGLGTEKQNLGTLGLHSCPQTRGRLSPPESRKMHREGPGRALGASPVPSIWHRGLPAGRQSNDRAEPSGSRERDSPGKAEITWRSQHDPSWRRGRQALGMGGGGQWPTLGSSPFSRHSPTGLMEHSASTLQGGDWSTHFTDGEN